MLPESFQFLWQTKVIRAIHDRMVLVISTVGVDIFVTCRDGIIGKRRDFLPGRFEQGCKLSEGEVKE